HRLRRQGLCHRPRPQPGPRHPQRQPLGVGVVEGAQEEVGAADVGGDGDLVGAEVDGIALVGRAYLFLGTFDNSYPERLPNRDLEDAERIYQGAYFGENVSAVGDVNGDGYADFAVSRTREG